MLTSGSVDCWGYGPDGELGNTASANSNFPVAVTGVMHAVRGASYGALSFCGVLTSGAAGCWGDNTDGELGDTSMTSSNSPVAVSQVGGGGSLTGVGSIVSTALFADYSYCALLTSQAVDCWGFGADGELGNNTGAGSDFPVQVSGVGGSGTLGSVASLAYDGGDSYCALLTSQAVDCWGYNTSGELGNNTITTSDFPVAVSGVGGSGTLGSVASLADEGDLAYCAVLTSGAVDCWGYGLDGENGNGIVANSDFPVAVTGIGP